MAKLPAFQFYPGDWQKDPNLRRCSHAAKGVWIDLLCLMFESEERGVLATAGRAWSDDEIAQAVGGDRVAVLDWLRELVDKGVAARRNDGALYSRRLVRDEQKRRLCSEAGKRGGNPTLKGNFKGASKGPIKGESKPNPTPSSSSSTSSPQRPPEGGQGGSGEGEDDGTGVDPDGLIGLDLEAPAPSPPTIDVFTATWNALDRWCRDKTRFPLGRGHNDEREVQKLLAALAEQPPIPHGGKLVPQEHLIPLAIESLMAEGMGWKSVAYARGGIVRVLTAWARTGAPAADGDTRKADATQSLIDGMKKQREAESAIDIAAITERDLRERRERAQNARKAS